MPSKVAFESVCKKLKDGDDLTLEMVGDTFGKQFWMLMMLAFLDAQDAARAIQLATQRIRVGERVAAASEAVVVVDGREGV